jgi:hypothetical protein
MPHRIRHRSPALFAIALAVIAWGLPVRQATAQTQARKATRDTELDPELRAAIASAPKATDWPNSNYARILDIGDVTVNDDGATTGIYRETYKLFNKNARALAEVSINYNSSYQSLKVISARTIKKDGTVVPVRPEDIRETGLYSEYLMYDDAKAIGFSMPAIEDDCVIDYQYKIVTRPLLMARQFWTYWGFSGAEPVSVSRYVLHMPTAKLLKFKVYNDDKLTPTTTKSSDGSITTYTWEERNIKPIDIEPYMPPIENVRIWMEVSSLDSWQDIAKWFSGLQKPQAIATPEIRRTVDDLTRTAKTDDEKARAIYDWVANRTRYVGLEFGLSAYRPHPAADVYGKLYGDCKDKANLLITMLNVAGIQAHPVLLHAEERRKVADGLPTLTAFDHCIAVADVNSREVWLDATAENCAYGDIPDGDRGVQVLVVRDGKADFETIPTYAAAENGVTTETHVKLRSDGSADIDATFQMIGSAGQSMRAVVSQLTPDKRKEVANKLAGLYSPGATVKSFTLPDGSDKNGPYILKIIAVAPSFAQRVGKLVLVPLAARQAGDRVSNPYTKETRTWPIVEEETAHTTNVLYVEVPDDVQIEDVPTAVDLESTLQSFHRAVNTSSDGKSITITENVENRAGTVPASEYTGLRDYYNKVLKAQDDQIVLRVKKP